MATGNAWWKQEPFASIIGDVSKGKGIAEGTGPGPDGKVNPQRQAPVGIMNTSQGSKMLHEGEVKMTTDDGRFAVIPSHVLPADVLKEMENQSKMGGFASGGTGNILQSSAALDNAFTNKTNQVIGDLQPGINPVKPSSIQIIPNKPVVPSIGLTSGTSTPTQPIPTLSPSGTSTTASQPATPQSDINLSSSIIRNYANGKPSAAANQAMDNQGAEAAAAAAALRQRGSMAGLTPEALATEGAVASRDQSNASAQLQGQLAATAQTNQLNAAVTLNQEAVQQDQTNYTRQTDAANAAFNSGNIQTGVDILNKLYPGLNLDATQMKNTAAATQTASNLSTINTFAASSTMSAVDALPEIKALLGNTNLTDAQISSLYTQDQANAVVPLSRTAANIEFPGLTDETWPILQEALAGFQVSGGLQYNAAGQVTGVSTSALQVLAQNPKLRGILSPAELATAQGGTGGAVTAPNPQAYTYDATTGYSSKDNSYTFTDKNGDVKTLTADQVAASPLYTQLLGGSGQKPFVLTSGPTQAALETALTKSDGHATFTSAGGIWVGTSGTTQNVKQLSVGQNIHLDQDATIQDQTGPGGTIPVGDYTVVQMPNGGPKALMSADGKAYYVLRSDSNYDSSGNLPKQSFPGYTWDATNGYYTKQA